MSSVGTHAHAHSHSHSHTYTHTHTHTHTHTPIRLTFPLTPKLTPSHPNSCQSFNMRHHSCARTAGGGICGFFNQRRLYELLLYLRHSVRLLLPSSAFLRTVRSSLLLSPCSVCKIGEPNRSPAPQPSMHPLARKPAWGTSFLTHNDLSIWGEVIHLACARGLHFSAFITHGPPLPPASPRCSVSWFLQPWV